jgi:hypothetical protein
MNIYLKYGVSAAALLAAVSLARAETNEHQAAPGSEHREGETSKPAQGKQGKASPSTQNQGERQQGSAQPKGRTAEDSHPQVQKQPEKRAEGEQGNKAPQTGQTERNVQRDTAGRGVQGNATVGRAENEHSRTRATINVTPEQKTHLHDVISHDSAIHRYRRSDINFSLNIGTRIPDSIAFYDPPPQFLQIDPDFQGYKIIVLDDVVLIVDPETREIVDVIQLA